MAAAGGPAAAAAAANRLSASVGLSTGNEATAVAAAVSSFPPTSAAAARSPKLVRNVGNGVVGGLLARDSGGSREPRSDWRRKQLRKVRSVELDGLLEPAECAELPLSASAAAATTDNPSPSSFAAVQPAPSSSRGFLLVAEQPLADSGSQAGAAERTMEPPLAGLLLARCNLQMQNRFMRVS
uniref:Uncharacterized protein n=1 Tax=Sphaerodactylus townsendi TaxID=933632 RepID=A0ACB8EPD9_9SAUR